MISPQEINKDDLISLLAKPTEYKTETQTPGEPETKPDAPKPKESDFSPAPKPEPEKPLQPQVIEKDEVKQMTMADAEAQADLWIEGVDNLSQLLLPLAYKRTLFTREELVQIKAIKKKIADSEKKETTWTPEEFEIAEKCIDYETLCDDLPYTDKETKLVKGFLSKVLYKRKKELSPEAGLIGASITIMAPRLLPLIYGFKGNRL